MKPYSTPLLATSALLILFSCKKNLNDSNNGNTPTIGAFSVSVTRTENSAEIEWTQASYSGNNAIVRYKVYVNNQLVQNTDTVRHYSLQNITSGEPYDGKVTAYVNANTATDASFTVKPYSGIAVMGRQDSHTGQN